MIFRRFANLATRPVINKVQLDPVPESAVRISLAGLRGLKYHGIPILPKDLPGAVRLNPRFSVAMQKGSDTFLLSEGKRRSSQK